MALTIERSAPDAEESRRLVAELWAEVDRLYGNEASTPSELPGMEKPGAALVIAQENGDAVACAAIRPLSRDIAEIKRMYVRPHARRAGVARAIMHELDQLARTAGFTELWLETGLRQPAAIRLYESLGYTRIAAYGDYKDDPLSVCYGKRLT